MTYYCVSQSENVQGLNAAIHAAMWYISVQC